MRLAVLLIRLLEVMFLLGMVGSSVVVLISFFDYAGELLSKSKE
ncbi:MAG: hypothetical protein ACP5FH_11000 [Terracidiphilus sp.]